MPAEHAVCGLHSVTLSETVPDGTVAMLSGLLGMTPAGEDGDRARFAMAGGGAGAVIDVAADGRSRGLQAGGTVHHIAFRVPDRATQELWRAEPAGRGVNVTEIRDRQHFTSTSMSPGVCCWRSPPTSPVSRSTSRCWSWGAR